MSVLLSSNEFTKNVNGGRSHEIEYVDIVAH